MSSLSCQGGGLCGGDEEPGKRDDTSLVPWAFLQLTLVSCLVWGKDRSGKECCLRPQDWSQTAEQYQTGILKLLGILLLSRAWLHAFPLRNPLWGLRMESSLYLLPSTQVV